MSKMMATGGVTGALNLPLRPDSYRLTPGVRVVMQNDGWLALCAYPLRVIRLSDTNARLLQLCQEQRSATELAASLRLPIRSARARCEQLRWKGLLEAGPIAPPATWPTVSIIIPAYNRAAQLERCLRSLFVLDYSHDLFEIVIVDDASSDATAAMLAQLVSEAEHSGIALRVIRQRTRQGVAVGRNTGAQSARYDILAYIDSDCVASAQWLNELIPAFQDNSVAAVGGMIRAYEQASMLGRYEDARSSLFMGQRAQQASLNSSLTYLPTANLLVRKTAWRQLDGFAPLTFGEDVDFCRRLLASKARLLYLPSGIVYHDYRTTLWAFLRIRASYASAEAALQHIHPEQRRVLVLPPEQAAFAGLTIGGLWKQVTRPLLAANRTIGRAKSFPYLFFFALILTLVGAFKRWRTVREQRLPIGPLAVLRATARGHLAYTYHLCRHLTRYYTLPLLLLGLALPPLLILSLLLCSIVIGVDYVRLRPAMSIEEFTLCAILDDCAYEAGVLQGCIKHRTWKPLVPVVRKNVAILHPAAKEGHATHAHARTGTS
ncbi:MAG TPA: mycofactocin biosynthesis glycosyltransferase MftF [Ktedonobacteraceae bacterium]|nr:mycofactocin biosynthesis glycosyltransferase MftF [Ktedonobacteraceae bacterium]